MYTCPVRQKVNIRIRSNIFDFTLQIITPNDKMGTHVTGVISHNTNKLYTYLDINEYPHDSNLTMILKSNSAFYKCPGYYCVPWRAVCNNVWDCPGGADETNCIRTSCRGNSNVMIPPYVYHMITFVIIPLTVCMEMMNTFASSQYLPALPIAPG